MFKKIDKHMKGQKENPAEHMKPTHEDEFPKLTQTYWANPNSSQAIIETKAESSGKCVVTRRHEGN